MPFKVQPATAGDMPAISDIYFAAFASNPWSNACFPDTPAVRTWWHDLMADEVRNQPTGAWYRVVEHPDGVEPPAVGDASAHVVAFIKWLRPKDGTEPDVPSVDSLPAESDKAVFKEFFDLLAAHHRAIIGTRAHWYLELLGVHPSYQRRGLAQLMISHILDDPESGRHDTYVESSPAAVQTYKRAGFVTKDSMVVQIEGKDYETLLMVRPGSGTTTAAAAA